MSGVGYACGSAACAAKSVSLTIRGEFEEALRNIDSCIVADSTKGLIKFVFRQYKLKVFIYEEKGDFAKALKYAERMHESCREAMPFDEYCYGDYLIWILARKGEIERAERMAEDFSQKLEGSENPNVAWFLRLLPGMIDFARGNLESSVKCFEIAVDSSLDRFSENYFQNRLLLARAYLESGRYSEAIDVYEGLLSNYSHARLEWPVHMTKAHYYLAQAYEETNQKKKAIEQYEEFLEAWKNADSGLKSVADAEERLARLKDKS